MMRGSVAARHARAGRAHAQESARMPDSTPTPRLPIETFLIALMCLIWGSTWFVIQRGLADLPPFTSAGARFVVAAIAMTAVAQALQRRESGRRPPPWLSLVVGICNFGLAYGIVYRSETRLPSGLTSVLWSIFSMLMALAGHLYLPGERLRARQWSGFATGFIGVTLLFLTDIKEIGTDAIPAALIMCGSPLAAAIGTTVVKRHGSGVSSVLLNRNAMWIGAGLLCGTAGLVEHDARVVWNPSSVGSVIYLALVGTTLAFGIYFWLLRRMPAHELSLISYVTPAIALLLGTLVGKESFTLFTAAGSGLILAGVWLVVRGSRRQSSSRS
jgi:drug/metabolite transporter (DMT)-like permease